MLGAGWAAVAGNHDAADNMELGQEFCAYLSHVSETCEIMF
jgi:hypothetical protein